MESSTGQHVRTFDNHVGPVGALVVPSTITSKTFGEFLVSASDDRTVRFWQPKTGRMVRFVKLPSVPRALAWSRDTKQVYVGGDDGVLRVIDAETGAVVSEKRTQLNRIQELIPLEDGTVIVAGSPKRIEFVRP